MEVLPNLKVHRIYQLSRMISIIVSSTSSSSKEVRVKDKVKDKVIKKETSLIKSNNSILWKRLTTQVTKETNQFELFMIILISNEIIKVLSVIEWIVQLITTMLLTQIVPLRLSYKLQVKTVTMEALSQTMEHLIPRRLPLMVKILNSIKR